MGFEFFWTRSTLALINFGSSPTVWAIIECPVEEEGYQKG
jgi:hypothetical protein